MTPATELPSPVTTLWVARSLELLLCRMPPVRLFLVKQPLSLQRPRPRRNKECSGLQPWLPLTLIAMAFQCQGKGTCRVKEKEEGQRRWLLILTDAGDQLSLPAQDSLEPVSPQSFPTAHKWKRQLSHLSWKGQQARAPTRGQEGWQLLPAFEPQSVISPNPSTSSKASPSDNVLAPCQPPVLALYFCPHPCPPIPCLPLSSQHRRAVI